MYYAIGVSAPCITFNIVGITETSWLHNKVYIRFYITKYGSIQYNRDDHGLPRYNCTFGTSLFQFQYGVNLRSSRYHVSKKYLLIKGVKLKIIFFFSFFDYMHNSPTRQD